MRASESTYPKNLFSYRSFWGVTLFITLSAVGLYYVKWDPYYHKAISAAAKHSIGDSIVAPDSATPPPPSWKAAAAYAWAYFLAVWKAMILGLLLGSAVEALIPKAWLCRFLGEKHFKGVALAGLASVPSMM
jgi:uncharacterized membrane protein YraQ (UPF0718 family)